MSLAQSLTSKILDSSIPLMHAKNVAERIRSVCNPHMIILFGSGADGNFRVTSDLDFLIVFQTLPDLQLGRKCIRSLGLLHPTIPVDLVFVSEETYLAKQDIGGVCFIAKREGIQL